MSLQNFVQSEFAIDKHWFLDETIELYVSGLKRQETAIFPCWLLGTTNGQIAPVLNQSVLPVERNFAISRER